jgi:hypothetical protein
MKKFHIFDVLYGKKKRNFVSKFNLPKITNFAKNKLQPDNCKFHIPVDKVFKGTVSPDF